MAKTVALSKQAYATLATIKRKDESFSDVVLRLAGDPKPTPSRYLGLWRGDEEIERIYATILKQRHETQARWVTP